MKLSDRPVVLVLVFVFATAFLTIPTSSTADECTQERQLRAEATRLAEAELDVGFERHFAEKALEKAERKLHRSTAARVGSDGGFECRTPTGEVPGSELYQNLGNRPQIFGKLLCGLQNDRSLIDCENVEEQNLRTACFLMRNQYDRGDRRPRDADLPIWVMDELAERSFEEEDAAGGLAALLLGGAMKSVQYDQCVNRAAGRYETEYGAWSSEQQYGNDPDKLVELCETWLQEWRKAAAEHTRVKEQHEKIMQDLNAARRASSAERKRNRRRGVRCR